MSILMRAERVHYRPNQVQDMRTGYLVRRAAEPSFNVARRQFNSSQEKMATALSLHQERTLQPIIEHGQISVWRLFKKAAQGDRTPKICVHPRTSLRR